MSNTEAVEHVHTFKLILTRTLLHKYGQNGKIEGSATASDTLKQYVCECGLSETYDLERKVIIQ